jgi:hypothetical protein
MAQPFLPILPLRDRMRLAIGRWNLAIVVSTIAAGLSGATFYRNFIYSSRSLELVVLNVSGKNDTLVSLSDDVPVEAKLSIAVTNTGNRDAAIADISPLLAHRPGEEWPYERTVVPSITEPIVLKPQEIRILALDFKNAIDPAITLIKHIESSISDYGFIVCPRTAGHIAPLWR